MRDRNKVSADPEGSTDVNKDETPQACNESQEQQSDNNNNNDTAKDTVSPSSSSCNWIGCWMWYGAGLLLLLTISLSVYENYYLDIYSEIKQVEAYKEYLLRRWSNASNELLAAAALDKSFTHYRNTRIFFRVMTRKVPIANTTPVTYRRKIALAEVDDNNSWRSEFNDPEEKESTNNGLRCVGADDLVQLHIVGLRSNGVRFTSSYASGRDPRVHAVRNHISCLQKVLRLMCEGDKWEVLCPPEEAYGEEGDGNVPPGAATVWRVSVERVRRGRGGERHTRHEAEKLLALVAEEESERADIPLTRRRLFEKSNMYLANSTIRL